MALAVGVGILAMVAGLSGCGGSTSTDSSSTKSVEVPSEDLKPMKLKGKTLPPDTNLSARERRALKKQGDLPTK